MTKTRDDEFRPFAFERRVIFVVLVTITMAALVLLIWQIRDVLLLLFGAILVATILHAIGDPLARWTPLSRTAALPFAGLIIVAVIVGVGWLFQAQAGTQIVAAWNAAQNALPTVGDRIGIPGLGDYVTQILEGAATSGGVLGKVTTFGATALQILTDFFIAVFGGVYLAIDPGLYRDGLVKLFPVAARESVRETFNAAGVALKRWLVGQLFSMAVTGTMTWLALWVIGLPSAVGLGLIAGLAEFIPLLGPFLGAIPALLIAVSHGPAMVLWTALAFIIVQQVESNLIQPLVARQAVSLPPALLLFAVVTFGVLFGIPGVLLASPLTVVTFVAVKKLYVSDTLGEDTPIPGEKA